MQFKSWKPSNCSSLLASKCSSHRRCFFLARRSAKRRARNPAAIQKHCKASRVLCQGFLVQSSIQIFESSSLYFGLAVLIRRHQCGMSRRIDLGPALDRDFCYVMRHYIEDLREVNPLVKAVPAGMSALLEKNQSPSKSSSTQSGHRGGLLCTSICISVSQSQKFGCLHRDRLLFNPEVETVS
jgi:hypothetical protein